MNARLNPAAAADETLRELMREVELGGPALPMYAVKLDRRHFLKLTGLAGGGLALGFFVGSDAIAAAAKGSAEFSPNAFLRISSKGSILIYNKGPEIGQGIKTAFPLIIAEELDAKWSDVVVEQAPVNPAVYGRQSAGGSRSIPDSWDQLRKAGAVARAMLLSAAAAQWKVPVDELSTRDSAVWHGNRSLRYGALATKAASLPVPDAATVILKQRKDYRLLGKSYTGVDNRQVVTGAPLFGIDQQLPGLKFAVFEKCPATGGKVRTANLDEVKKLPGVRDAFVVEGNGKPTEVMAGVAIVADSTWAAFEARKQLRVEWDESSASKDSWTALTKRAAELSKQPAGETTTLSVGAVADALKGAAKTVEGFYTYPFVSHAPLEPQNCTAWNHDGILEFWSPTQTADRALTTLAGALGVPVEKIKINQTRVGGGFGRRLMNDYACEAGAIAQRFPGPVKLVWTREQDMAHDFYRPGGFHSLAGGVDATGKLVAWRNHFISFTTDGKNPVSGGNLPDQEFPAQNVPNYLLSQTLLPLTTPCGPWRAPRSCSVAWVIQSFLHELSAAAHRDHRDFLLEVMGEPRLLPGGLNTGRAADVIRLATEKAGWGRKLPAGHGLGLAFHFSHAGHIAEVAEVSVDQNKRVRVHRVVVASDIGPIINMSGANNQCEGAVIDGFSTMLGLEITMENGRVDQSNFHQYPILRMADQPRVEVHFIQSDNPPTGVGEPALPPVAPAICNAIYAAIGHRVRTLPLTKEGFSV
ncbi:MAG TPA: molybdopterin cofactor-binding domain-containing protein [Steroidobacteraceae bacterium]|nr:molybdopterin cofactor-binding domain-containing protein [Steroidobacteraceae bacterium]